MEERGAAKGRFAMRIKYRYALGGQIVVDAMALRQLKKQSKAV